ncbi:MAG TPA: NUDIX domain-containing protein [Candidatus Babeliales bacterium]|nr:NUDIX domain-containing protein [Candidatus Babeliales bacterium]
MTIIEEEWLNLVDENDQVVGEITRSDVHKNGQFHGVRAVWFFIKNSQGQLWIPRRHQDKRRMPLHLDSSAAGCVGRGETYEEALYREVEEELNLDIRDKEHRFIGHLSPYKHNTWCWLQVFEMSSDEVPPYSPLEFDEHYWLTPQELADRISQGALAKSDLSIIIKELY